METKAQLLKNLMKPEQDSRNKVTIVGSGSVGTAVAFSILAQGVSNDVVIVGRNKEKVQGEVLDMLHGSFFLKNARICGSDNFELSAGSKLIIFTAGVRQQKDENRIDLVQKNIEILKSLLPRIIDHSPDCILIIVTNPCDVLAYVAWKISGLPAHRVIGSGTHLDSSRFRFLMAKKLGVAVTSMHGWIIGEHGDFSVPVWSGVNVAGTRLRDINPTAGLENDRENWTEIHKEVIKAGGEVIKLKGYTSWGIGLSCADIASSILRGSNEVRAVSTLVQGIQGIEKGVFLSLPCMLSSNGVASVINMSLSADEKEKFKTSADFIKEVLSRFNF